MGVPQILDGFFCKSENHMDENWGYPHGLEISKNLQKWAESWIKNG